MVQGKLAPSNKLVEEVCGWGQQCPSCAQSVPNLKAEDSEEEESKGQRRKTSQKEITMPQAHSTHHPMTFQTDYHITTRQRKDRKE